uniref:GCR115 n=1 Tax=Schmidtea mediterranea TaxID=79327 RepID=A0A193KUN2_SCHMD|nr:GCR115 [Schmidtea mediterranea]
MHVINGIREYKRNILNIFLYSHTIFSMKIKIKFPLILLGYFLPVLCMDEICWPFTKNFFLSMISKCPSSYKNKYLSEKCENPNIFLSDIVDYRPVIAQSQPMNVLYRNMYCAKCHNIVKYDWIKVNRKLKCKINLKSRKIKDENSYYARMLYNHQCEFVIDQRQYSQFSCMIPIGVCDGYLLNNVESFYGYIEKNPTIKWFEFPSLNCCKNNSRICIVNSVGRSKLFYYSINSLLYNNQIEVVKNSSLKNTTSNHEDSFLVYALDIAATSLSLVASILLISAYLIIPELQTSTSYMIVAIGFNIACLELTNLLSTFKCDSCQFLACKFHGIFSIFFHISETICISNYITSFWNDLNQMRRHSQNGIHEKRRNLKRTVRFYLSSAVIPLIFSSSYLLFDRFDFINFKEKNKTRMCFSLKMIPLICFYIIPVFVVLIYTTIVNMKICFYLHSSVKISSNETQNQTRQHFLLGLKLCFISGITWIFNLIMSVFPNRIVLDCGMIISHFNGFVIVVCFLSGRMVRKCIFKKASSH